MQESTVECEGKLQSPRLGYLEIVEDKKKSFEITKIGLKWVRISAHWSNDGDFGWEQHGNKTEGLTDI